MHVRDILSYRTPNEAQRTKPTSKASPFRVKERFGRPHEQRICLVSFPFGLKEDQGRPKDDP